MVLVQYWGLAPEINAIRLTTGPGAAVLAPVIAAYETAGINHLEQGAQQITTATSTAAGSWQGSGGAAMLAAAVPKSEWQIEAAAHAEKAVALLSEAAAAYAAAVSSTIPYPVVIANRIREATLQATNIIGQNTPAIIESNVEYGEYWSQNASAMTAYAAAGTGIVAGLGVPLRPAVLTGNPAAAAAGAAAMGVQFAQTGLQGATQALGAPVSAAGQAAAAPAALSSATSAGLGARDQGDGAAGPSPMLQPGGSDLLGAAQSGMGAVSALPQALQGVTSPLSQAVSQVTSAPAQFGGMLAGMPGLSGGPGGGLAASAPGANLASSVSGVNGGYGAGGGPVSAALSKPVARMSGPVGLPSAWWGPASVEGAGNSGHATPAAAARAGAPAGALGAPMGSGMYGMPAAAGAHRDQSARGEDDTALTVVLQDADAIPVLTADGVRYADGGG